MEKKRLYGRKTHQGFTSGNRKRSESRDKSPVNFRMRNYEETTPRIQNSCEEVGEEATPNEQKNQYAEYT